MYLQAYISCFSLSQHVYGLSLPSVACKGYLILFRTYVSRPSAGKGRAVLEGIGLAPETIRACYGRHPLEEEESVQDGLIKWAEGHHSYSPTWKTLLGAMEYAGVAQQHCQGLRDELYQKLIGGCLCLCVYACTCVNVCVHVCRPACVWMCLRGKNNLSTLQLYI